MEDNRVTIYLDFDGVLHPLSKPTDTFVYLNAFCEFLQAHPQVDIVISSSWREAYSFAEIRDFFGDGFHHRIIGVTPVLDGSRFDEIMEHREQTGQSNPFIVLDDTESEFPLDWPPLFLLDPSIGLDASQIETLAELIRSL